MAVTDSGAGRNILTHNAGVSQSKRTLAGTVKRGDPIGYSSGWVRADPDVAAGPITTKFFAIGEGVSGDTIAVCTECEMDGFTGGTIGGTVFLKDADVGKYAEAASGDSTDDNTKLGVIVSATTVYLRCNPSGQDDTTVP